MFVSLKKFCSLVICLLAISACKEKSEPISIEIAHVNDTHSHFDEQLLKLRLPDASNQSVQTYAYVGGYPRMVSKVNSLRANALNENKPFILLHAGDAFSGTLYFTLFKGDLDAEFMNQMKFDAMVIGNHEFDLGNNVLAEFSKKLDFPLLSANTDTSVDDPLHNRYLPFTIKRYSGQSIAIIGLTTTYSAIISSPSDSTKFNDEIQTAKETVKFLQAAGINKIVLLTHVGIDLDKSLAQKVEGVDVIIGGHSGEALGDHTNIGLSNGGPSPLMLTGPKGDPVCLMHSEEYAEAIGVTDIDFDSRGIVKNCNANNVYLVGDTFAQGNPPKPVVDSVKQIISNLIHDALDIEIIEKDPAAQETLNAAKQQVTQFASTVIGAAAVPLYHVRLPGDVSSTAGGALADGSMVAPHVAASMSELISKLSDKPYIAVMNAGGVRADLTDEITVGDAYTVLPYSSTLVTMKVSGASFAKTLQSSISNAFKVSGVAFPYLANVQYTLNLTNPSSPVVQDIQILSTDGNYKPLVSDQIYDLVTTSYLSGGGDLYSFEDATAVTDTGHVDAEALVQYIQAKAGGVINKISAGFTIIR